MKLIGYVRVSSEGQADNTSLEDQQEKITAYCIALNHELVGLYQDVQSGGKSDNRKGLQTAIADMLDGKADGLIVLKLDRLGRRANDVLTLIDKELQPNNKALIVIDIFICPNFQYPRDKTRNPTNQIYGKPELWGKRLGTKVG